MKLRSRIEFFLAKIAGRDIDVNTLIPADATTMIEKLMLEAYVYKDIGRAQKPRREPFCGSCNVLKAGLNKLVQPAFFFCFVSIIIDKTTLFVHNNKHK